MPRNQGRAAAGVAKDREQRALDHLREMLSRHNWRVDAQQPRAGAPAPDLVASRGAKKLAVELKSIAEGRADRLIPLWSQAWLQISHAAPKGHVPDLKGHVPVAIVAAEHIAPKAADAVLSFVAEYAPEAHAGVIDLRGFARFRGPLLHGIEENPRENLGRRREAASPARNLFSDLNQWMLKVLLAPGLPEFNLKAPRSQYAGPSELASAAGASAMSASRLLSQLAHEGYLDDSAGYVRLVRIQELLERWQAAVSAQAPREVGWRSLISGAAQRVLARGLAEHEGCLGLFAAAKAHRLGFVEGVPPHVYVRDAGVRRIRPWEGFAIAGDGEAPDVIIREAGSPQSIFRGCVESGAARASDILQVWLDVASHPARGAEQANLIWRKVLEPLCENGRA